MSPRFGLERGTAIDRRYIERFLDDRRGAIRGDVLEIGETTYARRFGSPDARPRAFLFASDAAEPAAAEHVVGDLTKLGSLPAGAFDCIVATQTLNVIYDVGAALDGLAHMLRPGGWLLVTAPSITQVSRFDMDRWGDFWRFTDASMRRLLESRPFEQVAVTSYGNLLAAKAFLDGCAVEDMPDPRLLDLVHPDYPVTVAASARRSPSACRAGA